MDLIFFELSILSHWKKENQLSVSPFIHSSLVANSLHLLTSYFSSQWHELVHILLAHPKKGGKLSLLGLVRRTLIELL
ncbi:hypothetical protein GUJ93_ZPchr0016g2498 [Zizania palustris]|uniref:Nodulin homeobox N-terminal domain-containing protein n=1 Tax=Zizania palustris TaxID=103762 RepID=A0A8J5SZ10_ZIZPA|nr:hypothetical protein GUJ93_ZPchr0016g2498 [Zizania palustris]